MSKPLTATPIGETLLRVMIAIALKQPDPKDRAAMLQILKKDGWL